jgi:hypothetical protein
VLKSTILRRAPLVRQWQPLADGAFNLAKKAPTTVTMNLDWKVYGPDIDGGYGGMQGTGGLEATVLDSGGAATGVINDYFGNGVATISGGSVAWNTTRVGG